MWNSKSNVMARKEQTKGPEPVRQGTQNSPGVQLTKQDQPSRGNGASEDERFELQSESGLRSEEIAERAYQIFEREGRPEGHDQEHWYQTERELRSERERSVQSARANAPRELRPEEAPRSARQHQQSPAP